MGRTEADNLLFLTPQNIVQFAIALPGSGGRKLKSGPEKFPGRFFRLPLIVKFGFLPRLSILFCDIIFILFDRQLIGRTALRRDDFEGVKSGGNIEADRFRLVAAHRPAIEGAAVFIFQPDFQPGAEPLQGTIQASRGGVVEGVDVDRTFPRKPHINRAIG
jgi:hypothetical protein